MDNEKVLSCIQPTGNLHLGNYFGAVKNWVKLQKTQSCIYGIVDQHAMTISYDPKELRKKTINMYVDLMACGLDPEKCILFVQSLVPQHTELTWILSCVTSQGELSRMTQFKDKKQLISHKEHFVSTGLFIYPVLQTADILVYRASLVPVGKDQEQHLELSRNIAIRFNDRFGDYFPVPEAIFSDLPKVKSLANPEKKMSKSLGEKHYIGLFEDEESIRVKVRSAVTDNGKTNDNEMSKGVSNLFQLLKACEKLDTYSSLMDDFEHGKLRYSHLKDAVSDSLVKVTKAFADRKNEILEMYGNNIEVLIQDSSAVARKLAQDTIEGVIERTGLLKST